MGIPQFGFPFTRWWIFELFRFLDVVNNVFRTLLVGSIFSFLLSICPGGGAAGSETLPKT